MSGRAWLRALTPEAESALGGAEVAIIDRYPFRIGRESRYPGPTERYAGEERRSSRAGRNNELYLFDRARPLFISREHLEIRRSSGGGHEVSERGSACGTLVGNRYIGGDRSLGASPVEDGNTIVIGGPESPYVFRFECKSE